MKTENVTIIKRFVSNLDSELVLATVSTQSGVYFAEVLGEKIKKFPSEIQAITYVEKTLEFFYISKEF